MFYSTFVSVSEATAFCTSAPRAGTPGEGGGRSWLGVAPPQPHHAHSGRVRLAVCVWSVFLGGLG